MATELMERIVIKYLDDNGIRHYTGDDFVEVIFTHDLGYVRVVIVNPQGDWPPMLAFIVQDMATFPEERKPYAATMCNEFNRRAFGKFAIDEDGRLMYCLELPVTAGSRPEDVGMAFDAAISTASDFHPAIMRIRWADASVEDEAARFDREDGGGGAEQPEPK